MFAPFPDDGQEIGRAILRGRVCSAPCFTKLTPAARHKSTTMGISKIAKEIILDELSENTHIEPIENVIFWALEHYANRGIRTNGELIAYSIVKRIEEAEQKHQEQNN